MDKDLQSILIVNPGSTSLKFKLYAFPGEKIQASGKLERIGDEVSDYEFNIVGRHVKGCREIPDYSAGVDFIFEMLVGQESALLDLSELDAVGFKCVHAGLKSFGPGAILLEPDIIREMKRFEVAAPVHNRAYLDVISCFRKAVPDVPLAGLFEPTFHSTVTEEKYICGVPYEWREKYGIRRYGFHGASHRYISERAPEALGWSENRKKEGRIVSCHLGGSSSLCAIRGGESVDTTMEFSPQSGIIHSARCETLDPFILIYAMQEMNLSAGELSRILCHESGIKAISGISGDMRDLRMAKRGGNERAELALKVFYHQVRKQIAAMTASIGGIDALVFTGGIGENGTDERWEICSGLHYLGIQLDEEKNKRTFAIEAEISRVGAPVDVWVIPTNEELIVAREVDQLISE